MEISEFVEECGDPEIEIVAKLDSLLKEENTDEEVDEVADGSYEDEDRDGTYQSFKKCQKVYHSICWLQRREESCSGAKGKAKKTEKI